MNQRILEIIEESRRDGWVLEPLAKELLLLWGLPVKKFAWARSREEAAAKAGEIGYPLVLKVVSPEIVHKSESGGVAVNLRDEASLLAAFDRMSGLPGFRGVLLDEMSGGVELIVGSKNDPQFGPIVVVGLGGTSVELYKDVSIRLAPLTEAEALSAVERLGASPLLYGYRGAALADTKALSRLIAHFSNLVYELGPLVESIDLNPVFCGPAGAFIADARIMLA